MLVNLTNNLGKLSWYWGCLCWSWTRTGAGSTGAGPWSAGTPEMDPASPRRRRCSSSPPRSPPGRSRCSCWGPWWTGQLSSPSVDHPPSTATLSKLLTFRLKLRNCLFCNLELARLLTLPGYIGPLQAIKFSISRKFTTCRKYFLHF